MNADEMKVRAGGRTVDLGRVWGNYFTDEADRSVSDHRTQLAADLVECFSEEVRSLLSPVSTHALLHLSTQRLFWRAFLNPVRC